MGNFQLEFYADESGRKPALEWMRSLPKTEKRAMGVALYALLEQDGINLCSGKYAKQLGAGIFELRVQEPASQILKDRGLPSRPDAAAARVSLRLFCHAHGDRLVLILGGYDKLRGPSPRTQQREIKTARQNLSNFRATQRGKGHQR